MALYPSPTKEDVIRELVRHHGRLAATAKALGKRSGWVRQQIEDDPAINAAYIHSRDVLVDLAEDNLVKGLQEHDVRYTLFTLSTLGKDRGFSERMEITGKDGGDIEVTLNLGRGKTVSYDENRNTYRVDNVPLEESDPDLIDALDAYDANSES